MKISLLFSVATGIYIHNIISYECEKRLTLEKEDQQFIKNLSST